MQSSFQRICLFGKVCFHSLTKDELLTALKIFIEGKNKKLVLNMNAFGVTTFLNNKKYAAVIKKSDVVYPDGWGPVLASRLVCKKALPERINVGDFIEQLLTILNEKKRKLFLIGCEDKTVSLTAQKVRQQFPNINICGVYSGFFSKSEEKVLISKIGKSKPDLVLVGMGVPNQELFLSRNWNILPNAVYMGVGGVFYYISGLKKRAPTWMRTVCLEWLFRLVQEPSRLGKRYTIDLIYFIWFVLLNFVREKRGKIRF